MKIHYFEPTRGETDGDWGSGENRCAIDSLQGGETEERQQMTGEDGAL